MEPTTDAVMCPTCNVALVDGKCPTCGATPTPAPTETTPETTPVDNPTA